MCGHETITMCNGSCKLTRSRDKQDMGKMRTLRAALHADRWILLYGMTECLNVWAPVLSALTVMYTIITSSVVIPLTYTYNRNMATKESSYRNPYSNIFLPTIFPNNPSLFVIRVLPRGYSSMRFLRRYDLVIRLRNRSISLRVIISGGARSWLWHGPVGSRLGLRSRLSVVSVGSRQSLEAARHRST